MEKKDIELLRKLLIEVDSKSKDTTQMFLRLWDVIDYLQGNKTEDFNQKMKKEYESLKEAK